MDMVIILNPTYFLVLIGLVLCLGASALVKFHHAKIQ